MTVRQPTLNTIAQRTSATANWPYTLGGVAAIINVVIIPVQIIVYAISPPPTTIADWFALLQQRPIIGLMNLDLLYLLNNVLMCPIYFALYLALRRTHDRTVLLALILGLVGIAGYFSSNTAFEMLRLSGQHAIASPAEQTILLAAGEAFAVKYFGTAFISYYILNGIALLMFAGAMLGNDTFGRTAAYSGLVAGVLMLVPSPFGTIGLVFAFASLLPWTVFSIAIARALLQMRPD